MKPWHYASLDSPRLQKLIAFMPTHPPGVTPREIIEGADCTRPTSELAELKALGIPHATRYCGLTPSGAKLYRYWLVLKQSELL